MYREMDNGGTWRGTNINYIVINFSSNTKKSQYNFIVSLLSLMLIIID